jgi:hypothetical protein
MEYGTVTGWVGAVAGGLLGVLGGAIGTYFTIKNTNGPRERLFAIKASIICWVFVALVFAIQKWNQTQLRIREEESRPSA